MPKNEENLTEEIAAGAPDFDPEEWEKKRKEAAEAELAGAKAAAAQRKESAAIIAEHDEMFSDMLFEMTMNEMSNK